MEKLRKKTDRILSAGLLAFIGVTGYSTYQAEHSDAQEVGSVVSQQPNREVLGNVEAANEFWRLNPQYGQVIDSLQIEQHKKDYLKFVAEGVAQVVNAGYAINPQGMYVKAPFETGYGTDWIARENNEHFGAQGGGRTGPTTEFEDGSYQPRNISFRDFSNDGPYASFFNYAEVITNRRSDIYWDSVHCGVTDAGKYVDGLLNRMNEDCDIVIRQGEWDPMFPDSKSTPAYATDPEYKDKLMNMLEFLKADEIFIPVQ